MTRGTFANIRIRNLLAPGTEGGVTRHLPDGEVMSIYDAAMKYQQAEGVPLVVLAGAEYGTGSSRDWAAKGTLLLGVRAVLAVSFERIHRSNLVGMGVLPLEFRRARAWQSLGLTGEEVFDIHGLDDTLQPGARSDGAGPGRRRLGRRNSPARRGSTRRSSSTTTATAASCRPCCASCCWKGDGGRVSYEAVYYCQQIDFNSGWPAD